MKKSIKKSQVKVGSSSELSNPQSLKLMPIFIAIVSLIGVAFLFRSFAASVEDYFFEPETASINGSCVKVINDSSASGGQAVEFTCTSQSGFLDPSGQTIPENNYPIPSGAIFMATDGNDSNPGTESQPVKTINTAVSKAPSGGTIVVRGGQHRDWHNSNGTGVKFLQKPMTIQSYPGEDAWFNGSDIVSSGWTQDPGGTWSRQWETPSFCQGDYYTSYLGGLPPFDTTLWDANGARALKTGCMYADSARDPDYPMAGDPQSVYINDEYITQRKTLGEVGAGSKDFFYDWNNRRIHIGINPSGNTVELSARPTFITLAGAYDFTVRGLGFTKFASSVHEPVVYAGLGGSAKPNEGKAVLERNVFSRNSGVVSHTSGPKPGTAFRQNVVAFNGYTALGGNGYSKQGPDKLNEYVIEDNIFNTNNTEGYGGNCTASCGSGNIKLAHMNGYTVRRNLLENALGPRSHGFWCDLDCNDGVIVNNVARGNGSSGIFDEVSNNTIIAGNLVYGNGRLALRVTSANVKIYNNTLLFDNTPSGQAVWIYDDRRDAPENPPWPDYDKYTYDIGPDTVNIEMANNLIHAPSPKKNRMFQISNGNTTANQFFSLFDHNIYYRQSGQITHNWGTDSSTPYTSLSSFNAATGHEQNGIDIVLDSSESGGPFVNRAAHDYSLKTNSEAYTNKGTPLPADVAQAMGRQAGEVLPRGFVWDGFFSEYINYQ